MPDRKRIKDMCAVFIAVLAVIILFSLLVSPKIGIAGSIISEILLFAIPFLFVKLRSEKVTARFNLKAVPARYMFGALLLTVGASLAANAVLSVLGVFFKSAVDVDSGINSYLLTENKAVIIIAIIVLPAICEELLFRGYIQSALDGAKPYLTIGIVGILFGIMHLDIYKLLPCAILGGAFAYITYVTGSVLPTIICHLLNNAYAVVTRYTSVASSGDDVYEVILTKPSRIYVAVIMLAVSFIVGYLGVKMLTGKKFKKPYGLVSTLLALGIIVGAFVMMTKTEFVFDMDSTNVRANYENTVTLERDSLVAINVAASESSGAPAYISVVDSNGDVIVSGTSSAGIIAPLEKGEYTVKVTSDDENADIEVSSVVTIGPEVKKVYNENK